MHPKSSEMSLAAMVAVVSDQIAAISDFQPKMTPVPEGLTLRFFDRLSMWASETGKVLVQN